MAHMTISELETKITLRNTLFALMHQSKRDTAQESAMLEKLGEASITAVDEKIRGEWLRDVNAGLKESAFIKIRSSSDNKVQRMIEAIKTLTYQKKTVREDKNSHELSLNTSDITINPVELDKFCGGIGAGDWQTIMYKLYLQISARALAEIGNTSSVVTTKLLQSRPLNLRSLRHCATCWPPRLVITRHPDSCAA